MKQPDEFISVSLKFVHFINNNLKHFIIGAGATVLLIIIILIAGAIIRSKNRSMAAMFNGAMKIFDATTADSKKAAPSEEKPRYKTAKEKFTAAAAAFEKVHSKYSGKRTGKVAAIFAGLCHLHIGAYDKSLKYYRSATDGLDKNDVFYAIGLEGVGNAHEGKKQHGQAVNYFKQLSGIAGFQSTGLYHAARNYILLGKKQEAEKTFIRALSALKKGKVSQLLRNRIETRLALARMGLILKPRKSENPSPKSPKMPKMPKGTKSAPTKK